MPATVTSIYLNRGTLPQLNQLAASRGYTQTRGVGAGTAPSIGALMGALAVGELVAIGPVTSWRQVVAALQEAEAAVSPAAAELLATIRAQIEAEADFDAEPS